MAHASKLKVGLLIVAACGVVGLAALLSSNIQTKKSKPSPKPQVITFSTDKPNEEKPDSSYKWLGSENDPKQIKIPTLGISGYIQQVGVDQHKQVAVPNNIHMAGWFVDTVKPGEKGLSVIDGHLNGIKSDGIFKDLAKLKAGDTYTIEFSDAPSKQFIIRSSVTVPTEEAAGLLFSQDPKISHQVSLITCGGDFDTAAKLYKKRVIVVSELITS